MRLHVVRASANIRPHDVNLSNHSHYNTVIRITIITLQSLSHQFLLHHPLFTSLRSPFVYIALRPSLSHITLFHFSHITFHSCHITITHIIHFYHIPTGRTCRRRNRMEDDSRRCIQISQSPQFIRCIRRLRCTDILYRTTPANLRSDRCFQSDQKRSTSHCLYLDLRHVWCDWRHCCGPYFQTA